MTYWVKRIPIIGEDGKKSADQQTLANSAIK